MPSYGDFNAQLLLIGLAPAAHGGNRTGRMFTGDSSGDWVAKVLYENGFATKSTSEKRDDGFMPINVYITAVVRCVPPQNKPIQEEIRNCSMYLKKEISILKNLKVIICLGKIAFDTCCNLLEIRGYKFEHGKIIQYKNLSVIASYHPSRQNTQTRRLAWNQWQDIFSKAINIINDTK